MSRTTLMVLPPKSSQGLLPSLDELQARVVHQAQSGHVIFRGAPGSGKTITLLSVADQCVKDGESFLFLCPDRGRVRHLQSQVKALAPNVARPVKTPAGFAYSIIDTWRNFRADPLGNLELLTGAQEDALIDELLAELPQNILSDFRSFDGSASAELRMEIRNLISTAQRFRTDSSALVNLGKQHSFMPWIDTGHILEFLEKNKDFSPNVRGAMKVTHASIEAIAADLLESWDQHEAAEKVTVGLPLPDVLIVDDAQDMSPSTMHLLQVAASLRTRIVMASDPDTCVATFRGALAHNDLLLAQALDIDICELADVYVGTPDIRSMIKRITSFTGAAGPIRYRHSALPPGVSESPYAQISICVGRTYAQMGAHIARILQENYLFAGIPWNEQVIIARSQQGVKRLATQLRRAGIPVDQGDRTFQFTVEPVTRILLNMIRHAHADGTTDSDVLRQELLASSFIRCDGVDLHRLLRAYGFIFFTEGTLSGGQAASIDDLFTRVLSWEEIYPGLNGEAAIEAEIHAHPSLAPHKETLRQIYTAHNMWLAMRDGEKDRPRVALWKIWQAAGVAEKWQNRAVESSENGRWYDDQLDAVVALFRVADIWEQRNPSALASEFAQDLSTHNFAIDTLAQTGVRESAVNIMTPTQAAGKKWDVVVVAGAHDGEWPNISLRNPMLEADILADIKVGENTGADDLSWAQLRDPRTRRQRIKDDEYRLFISALGRARSQIHLAIVANEDSAPSELLTRALGTTLGDRIENSIPRYDDGRVIFEPTPAPSPLDERGIVGDLRYWATTETDTPHKEIAQTALALLTREGINGAHPHEWSVPGPLTSGEAIFGGQKPSISPSNVERFRTCPLSWFAGKIGTSSGTNIHALRGTFIHSIAEDYPREKHANPDVTVLGLFEQRWPAYCEDLDLVDARSEREKIVPCLEHLQEYFDSLDPQTLLEARVEQFFRHDMGEYILQGKIDRLEPRGDKWRIVDFKTGTAKKQEEADIDPQLRAYQLLTRQEGYDVEGAQLQYLKVQAGKKEPAHVKGERFQVALNPQELAEFEASLVQDARAMNAAHFEARINPGCEYCPFTSICPAQQSTTNA